MHKPVVSTQETTGFSIRNRWFLYQKPLVPPCVLSTTPRVLSTTPRAVFATPRAVICQSIIVSVSLYLSYPQWFIFNIDRLTDFFAKSFSRYICSKWSYDVTQVIHQLENQLANSGLSPCEHRESVPLCDMAETKKGNRNGSLFCWRRERDSNPRYLSVR